MKPGDRLYYQVQSDCQADPDTLHYVLVTRVTAKRVYVYDKHNRESFHLSRINLKRDGYANRYANKWWAPNYYTPAGLAAHGGRCHAATVELRAELQALPVVSLSAWRTLQ